MDDETELKRERLESQQILWEDYKTFWDGPRQEDEPRELAEQPFIHGTHRTVEARQFIRAAIESMAQQTRLEMEVFTRVGLLPHMHVTIHANRSPRPSISGEEWVISAHTDDYRSVLYFRGQPLAAFYSSTRGNLYQAGAYIAEGVGRPEEWVCATNLPDETGKRRMNTWYKVKGISAEVAQEMLEARV
jgi:hypothetical protein